MLPVKKHYYSFFLLVFIGIALFSCSKEDTGGGVTPNPTPSTSVTPTTTTLDLTDVRRNIALNTANNIIIPAYQALKIESDHLLTSVDDFTNSPSAENLKIAQAALKNSWLAWQRSSMYLFGPAEEVALRKSLNTYPTDITLIAANIQHQEYILGSIANQAAIGFPAIDYLLNGVGESTSDIIGFYQEEELAASRANYLRDLADDISTRVNSTLNGWTADGKNYTSTFTEEDALGLDVGSSMSLLVNSLDLHFQRFARDGKVAIPAGVRTAGIPRPLAVESLYGGYSVELLVENLKAYQRLLNGTTAGDENKEGIFDYLMAIEAGGLTEDMEAQFTETITMAATLNSPFSQQIEADTDKVVNLFLEMQKIVVFIKSDMASILGITITNKDNDGD